MEKFKELGMSPELLKVIDKLGFEEPSEIQAKAIPLALKGKDIIGGSATGSGKTLAFSTAIIDNLKPNRDVQALILCPTRELAEQVSRSIEQFSEYKKLNVVPIYGGVSIEPQMRKLARADIVVGTPGRILDHMERRTLRLDTVKFLVLDEVDRMFDMGFSRDVERILKECNEDRQTMLFSATISPAIDHLSKKYTKDAVEVSVKSYIDTSKLEQVYYDVPNNMKFSLLVHLLNEEESGLVMIFCSTRRNTDFVTKNLNKNGIDARAIHGGLSQNQRTRVLDDFHGRGVNVIVSTDVAARGLDIKGVSHVYNYDLPNIPEDYVHRIGRTARAGEEGKAINLLSNRDYENFDKIKRNKDLNIVEKSVPQVERIDITTTFGRRAGREEKSRGRRRDDKRFDSRYTKKDDGSRGRGRRDDRGRDGGRGRDSGRGRSRDENGVGSIDFGRRRIGNFSRDHNRDREGGRDRRRDDRRGGSSGGRSFGSRDSGRSGGRSFGGRDSNRSSGDKVRGTRDSRNTSPRGRTDGNRSSSRGPSRFGGRGRSTGSKDGFRGSRGGRKGERKNSSSRR